MSKEFRILFLILMLTFATSLFLAAHTAINRYYDYETLVAPRSLHQMTQEYMDTGDNRNSSILYGGGLVALATLTFGGFMVAMNGGSEFLRQLRLNRRRSSGRQSQSQLPTIASATHAPMLTDTTRRNDDQ